MQPRNFAAISAGRSLDILNAVQQKNGWSSP